MLYEQWNETGENLLADFDFSQASDYRAKLPGDDDALPAFVQEVPPVNRSHVAS